jgi:WXXGXW repeat (2 copies)/Domain of unknown function (DUF4124)
MGMLSLTVAAAVAPASEIYKSVDAKGNVVYSDHLDSSMERSTTVQLEEPRFPPHEMHFCWTNCFTLILDNNVYRRVDGVDETWTVETFSAKSVVLHRHDAPVDWNEYSRDVVYAGQAVSGRLIGVTVNGKPVGGVDASWGDALNTLPGSNAERDAKSTANLSVPNGATTTTVAPPPLAVENQPALSQDGFLWTPGYWYWRDRGYLWIPGAWVRPPQAGLLWTPAYWDSAGTTFVFHPGYWGSTVGFYGGVNYGYGYFGNGYTGGHWIGSSFVYNSSVNHVEPSVVHHTYAEAVTEQRSQRTVGYSAGLRSGDRTPAVLPPHQPLPRVVSESATMTTAQRTGQKASSLVEKPANLVKTVSTAKHVTPPREAIVK